jgi:hypothetical protein
MGNFSEAVKEWNRRFAEDGWRSGYAPQLPCPRCGTPGIMLTTIYGTTRGTCSECEHTFEVA